MINQVLFHSLSVVIQEISKKKLRYLSGIVTSTFKAVVNPGRCGGRSGCEGWDPSGFGGGLSSDFSTIFV